MKPLSAFLVSLIVDFQRIFRHCVGPKRRCCPVFRRRRRIGSRPSGRRACFLHKNSRLKRSKSEIADLVRKTVLAATANAKDPEQAVQIAVGLATAAAQAVPSTASLSSMPWSVFRLSPASMAPWMPSGRRWSALLRPTRSRLVVMQDRLTLGLRRLRRQANGGGGVVVASPSH